MKFATTLRNGAAVLATSAMALAAHAQSAPSVPSAVDQVTQLTTGQGSYAAPMFLLAVVATGIGIGIKWIKRGKGAA